MVEWKKLGEVCTFRRGRTITAKDAVEGSVPVIAGGQTPSYYHNEANRTGESITIAGSGAYAGFVSYWNLPIFVSDAFTVEPSEVLLYKYVFQWLKMNQQRIFETQKGAGVPHVHGKDIANFQIPIPSLSEQTRIVSILDTFTASIGNLKKQIAERRKQYEYERDQLLDLEGKEGVEMKKLGECVLFITDGDHQPPPKSSEGIPFVTISDIEKLSHTIDFSNTFFVPQEYYNSLKSDKKAKKGDVLYTVTGSFGIPVLIEDNREFCFQRHIALIRPNNTIALSRYIYHWLCSNYAKKQGEEKASGGAQKTVSLNSLRSFRFYYPPLQAQSRIVSILDTFEASIANLEAQLKLREKQYEYYRNQLLTFE
ncbi:MAG: restriction endonuclease subunit S [Bacteroidaceae bacterium]|nr:restriction endonuclease subunit S [Bacteroidaceae bacterium]